MYDFSVEPYRLAEAVWPHVFGLEVPENDAWIQALPPAGERMIWSPSLYVGALRARAGRRRGGSPRRPALATLADDPGAGRPDRGHGQVRRAALVGAADPRGRRVIWVAPTRPPASAAPTPSPPDGAGSVYGLLAMVLPGFAMFRYPAKLVVLAST